MDERQDLLKDRGYSRTLAYIYICVCVEVPSYGHARSLFFGKGWEKRGRWGGEQPRNSSSHPCAFYWYCYIAPQAAELLRRGEMVPPSVVLALVTEKLASPEVQFKGGK